MTVQIGYDRGLSDVDISEFSYSLIPGYMGRKAYRESNQGLSSALFEEHIFTGIPIMIGGIVGLTFGPALGLLAGAGMYFTLRLVEDGNLI